MRKALPFLFAAFVAPLLAGCPQLDVLEGKESPYKLDHERRMALTTPEPAIVTNSNDPWPLEVDTAPDCVPVLRVTTCD